MFGVCSFLWMQTFSERLKFYTLRRYISAWALRVSEREKLLLSAWALHSNNTGCQRRMYGCAHDRSCVLPSATSPGKTPDLIRSAQPAAVFPCQGLSRLSDSVYSWVTRWSAAWIFHRALPPGAQGWSEHTSSPGVHTCSPGFNDAQVVFFAQAPVHYDMSDFSIYVPNCFSYLFLQVKNFPSCFISTCLQVMYLRLKNLWIWPSSHPTTW